jgi:hypothetical protein
MTSQIDLLLTAVDRDLGDPTGWTPVHTYPDSLAECVIDALWSERVRYSTVAEIVDRYRSYRAAQGADADTDGAAELVASFGIGVEAWIEKIGNRQRAYSRPEAPYKAELVMLGAQACVDSHIDTTAQLRRGHDRGTSAFDDLRMRWLELPSQHSGLTFERLELVAGVTDVPPDGWVVEYVSEAVGRDSHDLLGTEQVTYLLDQAAQAVGHSVFELRNAIWQFQTKADRHRGHAPVGTHRVRAGATAGEWSPGPPAHPTR